jgi:Ni,Fe-hydrogenase III large subunit
MTFIEDRIEEMRQRVEEIEPIVQESEMLKRSIVGLNKIITQQKVEIAQRNGTDFRDDGIKRYMRLPARKAQIAEILSVSPDLTNQQIGDRLGLTAARISQIRSAMA